MLRPKTRSTRRAVRPRALPAGVTLLKAAAALAGVAPPRTRRELRVAPKNRPSGRFVEVDGVRVHYIARGKGRPVVLLHGNGNMAEDFVISGLVDQLALQYRVIAIDRPGFGHTERPRHRIWTPSAQAHLVSQVLRRLRVERPVIVGHSWGTLVALALAILGGRDLRGLVLLSGYFFPTARTDAVASAPLATPLVGDALRYTASPILGRVLAQNFIRRAFQPRPVPARFKARFPLDLAARPEQQRAIAEDVALLPSGAATLQGAYPMLRAPTVIITGEADAVIDAKEQSRRLHQAIAGSRLEVLPKVGHMIHYAARGRNRIVAAIDDLMRRRARARSA